MLKYLIGACFGIVYIFAISTGIAYSLDHQHILEQAAEHEAIFRNVRIDGTVSPDEYDSSQDFGDGAFTLSWTVAGEMATFGITARTTGWVSVGFNPDVRMANADIVIGWVTDDGRVHALDSWSTGPTGPHFADVEEGGTDDIISFAGTEENGVTMFEFHRPLITGDAYDNDLVKESSNTIIWATGDSDQYESMHLQRGSGSIFLHEEPPGPADIQHPPATLQTAARGLWITHASLMSLSFLLMIAAVVVSSFNRKKKWWLKYHRRFGLWAGITLLVGFILAMYMVRAMGIAHFSNPHTLSGLVTVIMALLMPTLGYLMSSKNFRKYRKTIVPVHRWLGRLTLVAMLFVIYLGLAMVGII